MNILVVEDIKEQREALVKIIERNFMDFRVYKSGSVKKSLELSKTKNIDLFLLDIELEDGSGLELAMQLRKIDKYKLTGIVFITNNIIHIIEAFKNIHCYDFLVKPYDDDTVKNIISLFSKEYNSTEKDNKYIIANLDGSVVMKIYCEDIIYIEYVNRSCILRTKKGKTLLKGYGLSQLLKELDSDNIIQCHKSFAVNNKFIEKIAKVQNKIWDIYFWNCDDCIPLGYKYKDSIMEL